jgi:hypothetical protein
MNIENEFSILKRPLGRNLSTRPTCTVRARPPVAQPILVRPMASEAGPRGVNPSCAQREHGMARFARGTLRSCGVARLAMAHRRLIGGNMLQGEGPHYRTSPDPVWYEVQGMDGPRRHPHNAQLVATNATCVAWHERRRPAARRSTGR